jgi:hypothetical protein
MKSLFDYIIGAAIMPDKCKAEKGVKHSETRIIGEYVVADWGKEKQPIGCFTGQVDARQLYKPLLTTCANTKVCKQMGNTMLSW